MDTSSVHAEEVSLLVIREMRSGPEVERFLQRLR